MNIKLLKKIQKCSIELQGELKKNGKGFKHQYFRTEDIVPKVHFYEVKYNFGHKTFFGPDEFKLVFYDFDEPKSQSIEYTIPIFVQGHENPEKTVQLTGKMQTYYKRYLFIQAFDICEVDELELVEPEKNEVKKKQDLNQKHSTMESSKKAKENLSETQRKGYRTIIDMDWTSPEDAINKLYEDGKFNEYDRDKFLAEYLGGDYIKS